MGFEVKIALFLLFIVQIHAYRQADKNSFIVTRTSRQVQNDKPHDGKEDVGTRTSGPPKIYEMHVDSNITHRFAHTVVTTKVKNWANKAQETVFSIVLPKDAFISKFVLSIGDKEYDAYVKEKEQAKQIYADALASGQGAGLVSASARESNRFTVSVNVEPESKVIFYLTYEQLLQREDNQYELVINIHPKQPVKDLRVHVNINESQPLKFVTAPPIRSGNEINDIGGDLDPRAQIYMLNSYSAMINFSPNLERQKELAKTLGTNVDEGLSGQFIVQYDVERSPNGGEILLNDGYFVHFFAPPSAEVLPKHVLFVLDTSGSMYGTKLSQLKEAMTSILKELRANDTFHLIEFNSYVDVWDIITQTNPVRYPSTEPSFYMYDRDRPKEDITRTRFPVSSAINPDTIKAASNLVQKFDADGGTNIADALKVALYLVDVDKKSNPSSDAPQPMIIFLTDGEATVGETNSQEILAGVQEENIHNVPIFSLSFGQSADKDLLQKLSLRNDGFSRHIYEAADASLQLRDFYKHISSPILRNVTFKYVDDVKEHSKATFPILFEGSELVVVGQIDKNKNLDTLPTILATGIHGPIELRPEVKKPVTRLERLWAYKTIQQLLDDMERSDNKTAFERKALDLALKYSFVTPVSSLVVVKPNATDSPIVPVSADTAKHRQLVTHGRNVHVSSYYDLNLVPDLRPRPLGYAQPLSATYAVSGLVKGQQQFIGQSLPQFPQYTHRIRTSPPQSTTPRYLPPVEKLKIALPWIDPVLEDDVITTPQGTYKLGLNETSTLNVPCPATPKNGPGFCKLLHECPEIYRLLTNVYIFQQYYCEMRGFAAVCCPDISSN